MKDFIRPRLVLGSVLRPVDDHRMYEKLGIALNALKKYDLHIIGFCSQMPVRHKNITFHALFSFERMSVERIIAPLRFLIKLIKLKPEVVVVNSPDLLIVTIWYKILFGKKLIYDVLENYHANVMFANTFPAPVRRLLAAGVRLTEWVSRPFVTEYWLAERVYVQELPFVKGKYRIVENRFPLLTDVVVKPRRGRHHLLFSGTISESYGVFKAIDLVKALHAIDPAYHLTIIGFAAQPAVRSRLYEQTNGLSFIHLIGIKAPVPHSQILRKVQEADIGLLPYQLNKAVVHRVPTKMYDYLVLGLPCILSYNPFWLKEARPYSGLVSFYDYDFGYG